jgi:hypothetical protein
VKTATRTRPTIAPRYVPYGQRFGVDHAGYRHATRIPGPIERTPHVKLIWRSMPGGLLLFALCLVAVAAIVAFSAASPVSSRTGASPSQSPVEARSGGKVSR